MSGGGTTTLLNFIADPTVAYMLMLIGLYGLVFELTTPGAVVPGVIGVVCLILSIYSFHGLPVNYLGFLLILLSIALFILEVKIISHGLLAITGIVAMVAGSLMLFDTPGSLIKLSLWVILPAAGLTALFFVVAVRLVIRAHQRKPLTGAEGLIGIEGIAATDITTGGGMVLLHGELWSADAEMSLSKGDHIVVEAVSGLRLKVRKIRDRERLPGG